MPGFSISSLVLRFSLLILFSPFPCWSTSPYASNSGPLTPGWLACSLFDLYHSVFSALICFSTWFFYCAASRLLSKFWCLDVSPCSQTFASTKDHMADDYTALRIISARARTDPTADMCGTSDPWFFFRPSWAEYGRLPRHDRITGIEHQRNGWDSVNSIMLKSI